MCPRAPGLASCVGHGRDEQCAPELLGLQAVEVMVEMSNVSWSSWACKLYHSLLYHLAKEGDVAAIDTLLKHGADPEISTFSALFAAAQGGHSGVVRLLAAAGVSPCASGPLTGTGGSQKRVFESQWESALFAASARGHTEVVQVLLDAGAKVEHTASKPGDKLNWLEELDCIKNTGSPLYSNPVFPVCHTVVAGAKVPRWSTLEDSLEAS
eukprot:gene31832-7038_t